MRNFAGIFLVVAIVAACSRDHGASGQQSKHSSTEKPPVKLDLSTPDRTVKSYWALQTDTPPPPPPTAEQQHATDQYRNMMSNAMEGPALQWHRKVWGNDVTEIIERTVIEVKMESDSRAVVMARLRNVTPIPAGATPSANDLQLRRDGETYRYIVEKYESGWKIVQVQSLSGSDWTDQYNLTPIVPVSTYSY